jgi:hypothetical protein
MVAKEAEVVRNEVLRPAGDPGEIADAQFSAFAESCCQHETRRIRQSPRSLSVLSDDLTTWK